MLCAAGGPSRQSGQRCSPPRSLDPVSKKPALRRITAPIFSVIARYRMPTGIAPRPGSSEPGFTITPRPALCAKAKCGYDAQISSRKRHTPNSAVRMQMLWSNIMPPGRTLRIQDSACGCKLRHRSRCLRPRSLRGSSPCHGFAVERAQFNEQFRPLCRDKIIGKTQMSRPGPGPTQGVALRLERRRRWYPRQHQSILSARNSGCVGRSCTHRLVQLPLI